MNKKTYLQASLQNGKITRWSAKFPLKTYIAPMKFYSKQGQERRYRALVKKALETWQTASKGKIAFHVVEKSADSQINIEWKRVERKALGKCYSEPDPQDKGRLWNLQVYIGLTDGLVHSDYMDDGEVYHTILHEIGHALGLGHSPFKSDIMYTPHQKGTLSLSQSDILTLNWLYTFPQGATVSDISSQYGISASDMDEAILKITEKKNGKIFSEKSIPKKTRNLLEEQDSLANFQKYNLTIQNVKIPEDMKKFFSKPPKKH